MPEDGQSLSVTLAALADPTRRLILRRLRAGEATVKELSEPLTMSGPAVSKHLRVLERAGLIERGRDAQWRPCRLDATPIKEVADWANSYRQYWEANYDRLGSYLQELQTQDKGTGPDSSTAPERETHHERGN